MRNVIIILSVFAFIIAGCSPKAVNAQDTEERRVEVIRVSDRPWLGVQVSDITSRLAEEKNLTRKEGAYVNEIVSDSPAETAGMLAGDIIIRFGDREVSDADGLVRAVRRANIDEPVNIVVVRGGRERSLTVTLKERPRRQAIRIPHPPDTPRVLMAHRYGRLGVSVINLNPQLGEYFKVPDGNGVLVEKVHENTPAEKAGIKAGDVIVKINGRDIDTANRLRRVLSTYDPGDEIQVEIIRDGSRRTFSAQLEERSYSEFYLPDFEIPVFDREEFEINIFGPGGAEAFKRNIKESIQPNMEELKIQMEQLQEQLREQFKDFQIDIPERHIEIETIRRM